MEQLSLHGLPVLNWLFESTIYISILVCLIFIIKAFTKRKMPAWWSYCLWLLLLLRMVIPFGVESRVSVFNYVPAPQINNSYIPYMTLDNMFFPFIQDSNDASSAGISSDLKNRSVNDQNNNQDSAANISGQNISLVKSLLLFWGAGVLIFGIAALYKNFKFWLAVRKEQTVTDKNILDLFNECRSALGIRNKVKIIVTGSVKSPAIFGYFKPQLLLPPKFLETLNRDELNCVFLHELGHLKRHDIGISWLVTFLQIIYWFNPLVWYAFHHLRADQEAACDEYILSKITQVRVRHTDYARTIVNLLERFVQNRQLPSLAGIIENKSQIDRRITMILDYKRLSIKRAISSVFMLLIVACVFFVCSNGLAANKPARSAQDNSAGQSADKPVRLASNKPAGGDLNKGLILKYQFPEDKVLKYSYSQDLVRSVKTSGLSIDSPLDYDIRYSIKGTGMDDQNNLLVQITINDLDFSMGTIKPDNSGLKGKSFKATYSANGKQLNVTGTENLPKIVFRPGMQGGEQDVKHGYVGWLPDFLPDGPVKIGESWTTPMDRTRKASEEITEIYKGETTNVLEGIETVMGLECVKIKSQFKGTSEMSGTQMGQTFNAEGDLTGTATWYFAYKEGMLVKYTKEGVEDLMFKGSGMNLPRRTKATTEIYLIP